MGITIHFRFARGEIPEKFMNFIEQRGRDMEMKVTDRSYNKLVLHPEENCESIVLHWHKWKTIKARDEGWNYEKSTMEKYGEELHDDMWICSGFCKTQYAGLQAHVRVAELLRIIAGRCEFSIVSDEADYYGCSDEHEAVKNLKESFGASSKMISAISRKLKETFGEENVYTSQDNLQ